MKSIIRYVVVIVIVMNGLRAGQGTNEGTYQSMIQNALRLPRDMRAELASQSQGAISWYGNKMFIFKPLGTIDITGAQFSLQPFLPESVVPLFERQIKNLLISYGYFDGPNQLNLVVQAHNYAATYSEYEITGGNAIISLTDFVSGKGMGELARDNFEISAIAIAPRSHIIAYAGHSETGDRKNGIYWADVNTKKEIFVGSLDASAQRLQFFTEKILYVLSNKRLYQFDLSHPGIGTDQTIKDSQGNPIAIEDFVINKIYPDRAVAIMNQGLYLFHLKDKKFKFLVPLPLTGGRLVFWGRYIGIVLESADAKKMLRIMELEIN